MVLTYVSCMLKTWKFNLDNILGNTADGVRSSYVDYLRKKTYPCRAGPTLILNVISFNMAIYVILRMCGFSDKCQGFVLHYIIVPDLIIVVSFTVYKYGAEALTLLSVGTVVQYAHNLLVALSVGSSTYAFAGCAYVLGLYIEPYLPEIARGEVKMEMRDIEEYFYYARLFFFVVTLLVIATIPLHLRGYKIIADMEGKGRKLSFTECLFEIVYHFGTSGVHIHSFLPLAGFLIYMGVSLHRVHIIFGAMEIALGNFSATLKFEPLHQVFHEVKPLYFVTHLEHHICKGVYPNSGGAGFWEFHSILGGSALATSIYVGLCPHLYLFLFYTGVNPISHTMWPHEKLVSWHSLHHVILADIFAANVPSRYDKAHSKDFKKYSDKMGETSVWAGHEWTCDAASLLSYPTFGYAIFTALRIPILKSYGT